MKGAPFSLIPAVNSLHETFAAYAKKVDTYSKTWFTEQVDPQKSFLNQRPQLKQELTMRALNNEPIGTDDVYVEADHWFPERLELQQGFIAEIVRPGSHAEDDGAAVYFLIGLPGSGKSSALRPLVLEHAGLSSEDEFAISDADDLRVLLPEYAIGLGSGVVQNECAELMYNRSHPTGSVAPGIQGAVLAKGGVVVVDVIGDPEYLPPLVGKLREAGRPVYVLQASCHVDTCVARVMHRALKTGRFVPPALVRRKSGVPEKALKAAKDTRRLTGWAVIDTNGSQPLIIASHRLHLKLGPAA